jgi:CheY-like chemotaxis protein
VPHPLDALTVLVADDDADMRLYLRGCLRGLGAAHVLEAADGDEALRLALTADLVVSDVRMPGVDGLALCSALKAGALTCAIPVLLVSGETACLPPGTPADGFLAKPFNASGLRGEVERVLARLT